MKCTSASGKTFYCIPTTRSPELHAYCYRNATPSLCASIDSCRISYTVICTVRRPILSRYEGHFSTKVTLKTVVFIILVLFRTSSRVPADLTQIEQNRRLTLRYYAIVRVHVYSSLCHLNLQSRNPIPIPFARRQPVCVSYRSFVPKELDMNLTSLKVGIHRHCSINKLN